MSGGFITIDDRQAAIHQDRFENQALGTAYRLSAVGGDTDLEAQAAQHGFDDRLVDRVVFDQQHIAPFAVAVAGLRAGEQQWLRLLVQGQGNFQGEHRAAAFLALRAQGAAHALGEGAGNRQAQSGAAVAP
ncbi:hypothetical protein D3C87_1597730 [compost metagenome]